MIFLRFADLKARGVVGSRMTLGRLIDQQGFPPGRLITPNCRAWSEGEIAEWVTNRPVARKPRATGLPPSETTAATNKTTPSRKARTPS
jgi:predicted DNA-binding transcriptional regulator AlpA